MAWRCRRPRAHSSGRPWPRPLLATLLAPNLLYLQALLNGISSTTDYSGRPKRLDAPGLETKTRQHVIRVLPEARGRQVGIRPLAIEPHRRADERHSGDRAHHPAMLRLNVG